MVSGTECHRGVAIMCALQNASMKSFGFLRNKNYSPHPAPALVRQNRRKINKIWTWGIGVQVSLAYLVYLWSKPTNDSGFCKQTTQNSLSVTVLRKSYGIAKHPFPYCEYMCKIELGSLKERHITRSINPWTPYVSPNEAAKRGK